MSNFLSSYINSIIDKIYVYFIYYSTIECHVSLIDFRPGA